mmetsp:Transcript_122209/g.317605  ORF Transcript_122209/g.317605 Transcript_122209/m.317605 type:complete len:463 (-) Transcript_122209:42-1430(-)
MAKADLVVHAMALSPSTPGNDGGWSSPALVEQAAQQIVELCAWGEAASQEPAETERLAASLRACVQAETMSVITRQWPVLRAAVEHSLHELKGFLNASARDYHELRQDLSHASEEAAGGFHRISKEVDSVAATAQHNLQEVRKELDDRIVQLGHHVDIQDQTIKGLIQKEIMAVSRTIALRAEDLHKEVRNTEQRLLVGIAEEAKRGQAYSDEAADARKAWLDQDLQRQSVQIREAFEQIKAEEGARQALAAEVAEAKRQMDERCDGIGARFEELSATTQTSVAELLQSAKKATSSAKKAASTAEALTGSVDEKLQQSVHKASNALRLQLEAAAKDLSEKNDRKVRDLETGLQGLIAKEALAMEMQTMLDRASQRLQQVSDDIAYRSAALVSNHHIAAESLGAASALPPQHHSSSGAHAASGSGRGNGASAIGGSSNSIGLPPLPRSSGSGAVATATTPRRP